MVWLVLVGALPGCVSKEIGGLESDADGTSSMDDAGMFTAGDASGGSGDMGDTGDEGSDGSTDGGPADPPPPPCLPGESSSCACLDGSFGTSVCAADQTWGPCAGCGDEGCGKGGPCETPEFGCNPWADDCPVGEKCRVDMGRPGALPAGPVCVRVGEGEPGDECELADHLGDTCDSSSYCIHVGGEPRCVITCEGSAHNPSCPPEAGDGAMCFGAMSTRMPSLCHVPCDPLRAAPCTNGEGCISHGGEFSCFPLAEKSTLGEECRCGNCCDQGFACVRAEDFGPGCEHDRCCAALCDATEAGEGCRDGETCLAIQHWSSPNRHVGRCVPAP